MQKLPVFVYGTLRQNQSNYAIYLEGQISASYPAHLKHGKLYHFGSYPGLLLSADGGKVIGELMYLDETNYDQILANLDILEGCEEGLYERITAQVFLNESAETRTAWVYIIGQPLHNQCVRLIESGDWLQEPAEQPFNGVQRP